jgi:hypothetical protein
MPPFGKSFTTIQFVVWNEIPINEPGENRTFIPTLLEEKRRNGQFQNSYLFVRSGHACRNRRLPCHLALWFAVNLLDL